MVGVHLSGEDADQFQYDLDELEQLLATLGVAVAGRTVQKRSRLTSNFLLGTGKVDEIKQIAKDSEAKLIVFDRPLTGPQVRNLEKETGCQVLDRTGVILEIFSDHAKTNQAKTQVEIARLEYMLPRLTGAWTHFQRQKGGGVRSRGMGEKQIEVDRRQARQRIARLNRQLDQIKKEKDTQRKARRGELKVALVGYTNSGKTSLLRNITKSERSGEGKLFATLDTQIKVIDPKTRPKILISDTVGFIRNLPHELVESFKSTLTEVVDADLILHVIDLSHPQHHSHIETTDRVLAEIGAENVPVLHVFNKADLVDDPALKKIKSRAFEGSVVMSAHRDEDVLELRRHIYDHFKKNFIESWVAIPSENQQELSYVYNHAMVLETSYAQGGLALFHVRMARSAFAKISGYKLDNPPEIETLPCQD